MNRGYSSQVVKKVVKLIKNNEFKRRQSAPGPKVTHKAIGNKIMLIQPNQDYRAITENIDEKN